LRQAEMEFLLDGAKEYKLDIYDRHFKDKQRSFPKKYRGFILGSLEYEKMVKEYKKYKIFLNANIVFYSKTMFSRRVFEILASGTNVISAYSIGIYKLFKNIVPLASNEEQVKKWIE